MFSVNFKNKYKIVHLTGEIGEYLMGGAGTYMNEIYNHKTDDMGFVYMYSGNPLQDIDVQRLPGQSDILVMHRDEYDKLTLLDFNILVVHFYDFSFCITEKLLKCKKIVYVVHSIPTPEPLPFHDPFGGNFAIRYSFEHLCESALLIICVSDAEQKKLISIYPQYEEKITYIHNGITIEHQHFINTNYQKSRHRFGYIGRVDYRKGILEMIKEFTKVDGELYLACVNNDIMYMSLIINYIEAANLKDKIHFLGWCVGKRKENFFKFIDALIIPSLYEPFGYVALEAMKYSIPIICSNNGGLSEIIGTYKYQYNPYIKGQLMAQIQNFQGDSNETVEEQQNVISNRNHYHTILPT